MRVCVKKRIQTEKNRFQNKESNQKRQIVCVTYDLGFTNKRGFVDCFFFRKCVYVVLLFSAHAFSSRDERKFKKRQKKTDAKMNLN